MADIAWSPGAVTVLAAIRSRCGYSRLVDAREAISAIAGDTLPGETVTGQALLDPSVWPSGPKFITGPLRTPTSATSPSPVNVDTLVFAASEEARNDKSRKLGERHLMTAFMALGGASVHLLELNRDSLLHRIRALELGSPFAASEI